MSNNTELENMKNAWQSLSTAGLKKEIDKDAIEKMMRRKSKSELNKLILTFTIEWLATIPILIIMMFSMHHTVPSTGHIWVYDVFMIAMLVFLLIPMRYFLKVGKFREQSIVEYLSKLTSVFDQVIKTILNMSKVFLAIAFPVGLISAGLHVAEDWKVFLIAMVVYVPFYVGVLFLIKWYYRYFYGRRIARMKDYLRELKIDVGGEDADAYDECQQTSVLEEPMRKGKSFKLVIICAALVVLILLAGVVLFLCGDDNGVGYYIGYGLGWAFKSIQNFFVS